MAKDGKSGLKKQRGILQNPFNFYGSAKGPDAERIQQDAQRIQSDAEKFARNLTKQATSLDDNDIASYGMVQLGPIKTIEAIIRKVVNDYNGDFSKVADGCRLQILTNEAKDDERICELLTREYGYAQKNITPAPPNAKIASNSTTRYATAPKVTTMKNKSS